MPISFIPYTAVYGPLSLPGVTCTLWLDAADTSQLVLSGTNVTTWKDKSGFGNSCSNITAGTSITYPGTIVNGLNTVGFTGGCIRGAFNGASANTGTNVTVFMVAAKGGTGVSTTRTFALSDASYIDDSTSTFLIYGPGTTTIQYFRAQYTTGYTIIANTTFLYTVTQTSGSGAQYFNGGSVQTDTITTASFAVTNYNIGTTRFSNSQNYYGPVSEVIVYNAFLGDTQRQAIEGYLAQKWGLTSQLPPGHPGLSQTLYNSKVYAPRIPQQNAPYTKNYFPLSIAACALWLDGADPAGTGTPPANGATVSTWIDKSTNKANGTAAGGTVTYNSSEKGLTFTGSYFSLPNNTISPGAAYYTIFCIVKATNLSNYPYLWFAGTGGPAGQAMSLVFYPTGEVENGFWTDFMGLAPAGTVAINNRYMFSSAYNGAVVGRVLYKNGTSVVSGTPTTTKNTQSLSYVSTPGGSALTGIYNELIVFNRFLTTDERQSIEGYLAWKWGLQSSLISHPYSSQAPPTVISINPLQLGSPIPLPIARLPPIVATGGTITFSGSYKIHTFTTVGTTNFVVSQVLPTGFSLQVLVVAGGGGGGVNSAGGGGAGGAIFVTSQTVTSGSYSIVVGAGGSGGINLFAPLYGAVGSNGSNSTAFGYTGIGGGGGGYCPQSSSNVVNGVAGGCGGGGAAFDRGASAGIGGTPLQAGGFAGGNGVGNNSGGAGGGGMGSVGSNGSGNIAGSGGNGATYTIGGTAYTLSGGGGGGSYAGSTTSSGGSGGGGAGAQVTNASGGDATYYGSGGGGGAGGGGAPKGGDGYQGIVIIAYNYL